jgi:hypothetical protein
LRCVFRHERHPRSGARAKLYSSPKAVNAEMGRPKKMRIAFEMIQCGTD